MSESLVKIDPKFFNPTVNDRERKNFRSLVMVLIRVYGEERTDTRRQSPFKLKPLRWNFTEEELDVMFSHFVIPHKDAIARYYLSRKVPSRIVGGMNSKRIEYICYCFMESHAVWRHFGKNYAKIKRHINSLDSGKTTRTLILGRKSFKYATPRFDGLDPHHHVNDWYKIAKPYDGNSGTIPDRRTRVTLIDEKIQYHQGQNRKLQIGWDKSEALARKKERKQQEVELDFEESMKLMDEMLKR